MKLSILNIIAFISLLPWQLNAQPRSASDAQVQKLYHLASNGWKASKVERLLQLWTFNKEQLTKAHELAQQREHILAEECQRTMNLTPPNETTIIKDCAIVAASGASVTAGVSGLVGAPTVLLQLGYFNVMAISNYIHHVLGATAPIVGGLGLYLATIFGAIAAGTYGIATTFSKWFGSTQVQNYNSAQEITKVLAQAVAAA